MSGNIRYRKSDTTLKVAKRIRLRKKNIAEKVWRNGQYQYSAQSEDQDVNTFIGVVALPYGKFSKRIDIAPVP